MPSILAFDTATATGSVAVLHQGRCVSHTEPMPREHSQRMLPLIDRLLQEASVELSSLDAIAFTHGPGSFMGVRLATGFAQGLAFGADIPVIPLSTLQVLAQTAYATHGVKRVLAAWDARMDSLYWGGYVCDAEGVMQPVLPDALTRADAWVWPDDSWNCVGNAWSVYQSALPEMPESIERGDLECVPDAEAMLTLAQARLLTQTTTSPLTVQPLYLRNQVAHEPKNS